MLEKLLFLFLKYCVAFFGTNLIRTKHHGNSCKLTSSRQHWVITREYTDANIPISSEYQTQDLLH